MKIGYKATYNMKCRNLTYEVGKTYTIDNMAICSHGFHYCKVAKDVLDYYDYTKGFVLLELEILGDVIADGNKSVTDKVKVLRIIPKDEYPALLNIELDEHYNIVYRDYQGKTGRWEYKYDEKGNTIYKKDSYGYEWYYKYDDKGNIIYKKDSYGQEWHWKYDDNGNIIHAKDPYGVERNWECRYDKKGNLIFHKKHNGPESLWSYDDEGNILYTQDPYGAECHWTYDDTGCSMHVQDFAGREAFYRLDKKGNAIACSYANINWNITIE